jgi:hypothetical protein
LNDDFAALVQSGAAVVREIDAKQGGLFDMGIYDASSNGCTVIALMLFALFNFGCFNCSNFTNVIKFWSGPVLKTVRELTGGRTTFVEPEPAFDRLQNLGLIPPQVSSLLYIASLFYLLDF